MFLSSESIRRLTSGRAFAPLLPALAVLVVTYTLLVSGRSRPVVGARVRGGPTEGARAMSFRVEVVERDGEDERPIGGRNADIEVRLPNGTTKSFTRFLDSDGSAAIALEADRPAAGPVHVTVRLEGQRDSVLDGSVQATALTWASGARQRGEWVDGRTQKGLVVRASAERGVFAVPFQDGLKVEALRQGVAIGGITVKASSETSDVEPASVVTDPSGFARLLVRPREHAASVTLRAQAPDGVTVSLEVALAVVPGALHAVLSEEGIVVESPIARTRAYVALVSEHERIVGGPVTLSSDGRGNARGAFPIPALPPDGLFWAVASSEPDLHSAALVGWPLRGPSDVKESVRTFDVPDLLLADGLVKVISKERARVRSARLSSAAFALFAITLTVLLVTRTARRSAVELEAHLGRAGADAGEVARMATSRNGGPWSVVMFGLCLGLAAALIGVFVLFR